MSIGRVRGRPLVFHTPSISLLIRTGAVLDATTSGAIAAVTVGMFALLAASTL